MDIHKPKPWHGVREFLKEYLIIVVGVLTALAFEQAVEWVHTAQKAAEAEDLVREEMARNVAFAQESVLRSTCQREQFRSVERLLLATPADRPVALLSHFGIYARPFTWANWEGAVASGIAGHFPAGRRILYQRVYLTASHLNGYTEEKNAAGGRLMALKLAPRRIDAATREQLLQGAAQADYAERGFVSNAELMIEFAAPLHLPPARLSSKTVLTTPQVAQACVDAVRAEEATMPPMPTVAR